MKSIGWRRELGFIADFRLPFSVLIGILVAVVLQFGLQMGFFARVVLVVMIVIGSLDLGKETIESLKQRKFALDYIALLAITVAVISGEFLVGAVIVLMLTGGRALEAYALKRARKSLTALVDRIPNDVTVQMSESETVLREIEHVEIGEKVLVRKGEVVPLDGILVSNAGMIDESSLTGEPYLIEKFNGDVVRSGTVNVGDIVVVQVTKSDKESTYRKIIEMVKQAQEEKAPLIRLADKYSTIFTVVTLVIAVFAYVTSGEISRVLTVLVIATPCPLILATPIALIGGMNAAAKKRMILKNLASLEVLSRVDTIVFDKTGTLTLGKPRVAELKVIDSRYTPKVVLGIAAAIERNSLRPLAKAVCEYAKEMMVEKMGASYVREAIGEGIVGQVGDVQYKLSRVQNNEGMSIQLITKDEKQVAVFVFEDEVKAQSKYTTNLLVKRGVELHIFTGDKWTSAKTLVERLGINAKLSAEMKPVDKKNGIEQLKKEGKIVAMVGDGINDAPALARADVGMVFSNEEHTAATDAADVVFLGGEFDSVTEILQIGKRTISIAMQSIVVGIGLSIMGMVLASVGLIPAVMGAFLQEAIDVAVILNALRAAR